MLYIGLKREKHEKIFWSETHKAQSHDIWYVASSCGLCPWGIKWPHPGGHILYIGLYYREKHGKIFLSETIRLRALIFGL